MTRAPATGPHPVIEVSSRPDESTSHGELQFIGTATVLLHLGGFTLLTDPNFLHEGEHAPLGYGLRSERVTEPAMQAADLPPIDAVILSQSRSITTTTPSSSPRWTRSSGQSTTRR